jgi:hypothetical protein
MLILGRRRGFLAERLQHCAQGFYVDQGDYGHMEAIMQDYHSIMRADKAEGADNASRSRRTAP